VIGQGSWAICGAFGPESFGKQVTKFFIEVQAVAEPMTID
jgi:hypothetical protein